MSQSDSTGIGVSVKEIQLHPSCRSFLLANVGIKVGEISLQTTIWLFRHGGLRVILPTHVELPERLKAKVEATVLAAYDLQERLENNET